MLNEKLLKFAGFKCIRPEFIDNTQDPPILYPACYEVEQKGKYKYLPVKVPDFTNSLDACFKWLVPKVYKEYPVCSISFDAAKTMSKWWCNIDYSFTDARFIQVTGETPALALCKAIERLIDETSS